MSDDGEPRVAFFRPADDREERAVEAVRSRGMEPLSDPLLETRPTGAAPRTDADYVVLTSVTGVGIAAETVRGCDAVVCAVGPKTAEALRDEGIGVDVVPEEYTSGGLVDALDETVEGARVEVARSDHGSDELLDGLNGAGAYVHETVLYELVRPEGGGERTVEALACGEVDAVLFTSSLTVEHLLEAAKELDGELLPHLDEAVVGVIGEPTRRTAESLGVDVDYVADEATFDSLVRGLQRTLHERHL